MGSQVYVGIQRILVAYDGSPHAEHAMNVALSTVSYTHLDVYKRQ